MVISTSARVVAIDYRRPPEQSVLLVSTLSLSAPLLVRPFVYLLVSLCLHLYLCLSLYLRLSVCTSTCVSLSVTPMCAPLCWL